MKKILITGGAGFIGSNTVAYFLNKKQTVTIFDNFSRHGSRENVAWLRSRFANTQVIEGDVTDLKAVTAAVKGKDIIIHLAAQVAVTTSVSDPKTDFDTNALGTFHVLEAARTSGKNPIVIYASTNKVYGNMTDVDVVQKKTRYEYGKLTGGISEEQLLDFHSPYGCSKGAADQYVHDYARIYGLPTVVFRQSCIYGPRQFGIEDQGWIAWFIIALALEKKIKIYGDGKQVRDILYVDDLVRLYESAINHINVAKGQVYNVGGGPKNSISVWSELKPILEGLHRKKLSVSYANWRPGDQKIYISNISKVKRELGWEPKVSKREGIKKLFNWVAENKSLFGV